MRSWIGGGGDGGTRVPLRGKTWYALGSCKWWIRTVLLLLLISASAEQSVNRSHRPAPGQLSTPVIDDMKEEVETFTTTRTIMLPLSSGESITTMDSDGISSPLPITSADESPFSEFDNSSSDFALRMAAETLSVENSVQRKELNTAETALALEAAHQLSLSPFEREQLVSLLASHVNADNLSNPDYILHETEAPSKAMVLSEKAATARLYSLLNTPAFHLRPDAEEAVFLHISLVRLLRTTEKALRLSSWLIRTTGDTVAGLASGLMRGVGGMVNLLSTIFEAFSKRLEQYSNSIQNNQLTDSSHESVTLRTVRGLQHLSAVLRGVSQAFVWGGEVTEVMTLGLGEAVQDSLRGLELLSRTGYHALHHLLVKDLLLVATTTPTSSQESFSSFNKVSHETTPPVDEKTVSDYSPSIKEEKLPENTPSVSLAETVAALDAEYVTSIQEEISQAETTQWCETSPNTGELPDVCQKLSAVELLLRWIQGSIQRHWRSCGAAEWWQRVTKPLHDSTNVASLGPQLFFALCGVIILSQFPWPRRWQRLLWYLCLASFTWYWLLVSDVVLRQRVAFQALTDGQEELLMARARGSPVPTTASSISAKLNETLLEEAIPNDEVTWLNGMLLMLWTITDVNNTRGGEGGLGKYMSSVYEELLSEELAAIPPAVANLRLKKFDFGTKPPLVRSLQTRLARDDVCVADYLRRTVRRTSRQGSNTFSSGSTDDSNTQFASDAKSSWQWPHHNNPPDFSEVSEIFEDEVVTSDQAQAWIQTTLMSGLSGVVRGLRAVGLTSPVPSVFSKNSSRVSHVLGRFHGGCDRFEADMDVVFSSEALDVVLSLRSPELKSMVPEVSVSVTNVRFVGSLRISAELTPDYPFFGNATVMLRERPTLDFSVVSSGGLELSSFPLAYYFVNSSMHFVLDQFTDPGYCAVDLRHLLCPECDATPPVPSVPAVLYAASQRFSAAIRTTANSLRRRAVSWFVKAVEILRRRRIDWDNGRARFIASFSPKPLSEEVITDSQAQNDSPLTLCGHLRDQQLPVGHP